MLIFHSSSHKLLKTIPQSPLFYTSLNLQTLPYSSASSSLSSSAYSGSSNPVDNNLKKLYHKDWLSPNEVVQIFKTLDPNSVLTILNHVSKRRDFVPREPLFTVVITKLGKAGNFDAIDDLMQKLLTQKSCRLSDDFFYDVIKVYGNVGGRIKRAIETLFDMPKYNCWPEVRTFNFVLNLLVSSKNFDVIHEVLMGASKLGLRIDACSLNILIKGLCDCGKLEGAIQVLDEFAKQGYAPNEKSFSTIMHGLCDHGRVDEAFMLLERMEDEGIDPDTITFNILISGLQKEGKIEEAMELLDRMKLKGCEPNSGSYQQVLYGLLRTKKFVLARDVMRRMILKGMKPSFESYKLLILGLCEENLLGDVDWVLKQLVRHGFVPRMGMWRKMVQKIFDGNVKNSPFDEIVEN